MSSLFSSLRRLAFECLLQKVEELNVCDRTLWKCVVPHRAFKIVFWSIGLFPREKNWEAVNLPRSMSNAAEHNILLCLCINLW